MKKEEKKTLVLGKVTISRLSGARMGSLRGGNSNTELVEVCGQSGPKYCNSDIGSCFSGIVTCF